MLMEAILDAFALAVVFLATIAIAEMMNASFNDKEINDSEENSPKKLEVGKNWKNAKLTTTT